MKTSLKYTAAFLALAAALAPIYWLVTISLKREIDQFASPPLWFSFTPTLRHYSAIFSHDAFGRYFLNSVIVSTCSTLIALALGLPAAYGLVRFPWPHDWARGIGFWILSNRMLPPIVTIIPLFLMLRELRLLNSLSGLVLVDVALNLPFVVWMMRGFVEDLPREIIRDVRFVARLDRRRTLCGRGRLPAGGAIQRMASGQWRIGKNRIRFSLLAICSLVSHRPQHSRLHVEHRTGETVAVGDPFAVDR